MGDKDMKMTEENTEKNAELIMEETMKEIYDEVNRNEEEEGSVRQHKKVEKAGKTNRKKASDRSGSHLSVDDLGSSQTAGRDKKADKKNEEDSLEVKYKAQRGRKVKKEKRKPLPEEEYEEELLLDAKDGEELEPVLSAEDGEAFEEEFDDSFDEEEETDEEKAERLRKRKKVAKIVLASILGVTAAVYLGFAFFFMSHFQFQTTINGTDHALESVSDVENYMKEQVAGYTLTLHESDGDTETISGSEIDLTYKKGEELEKLLKEQNAFLWPMSLWKAPEITASIGVEYDSAKLTGVLDGLACMKEENQQAPVSAIPEYNGTEFVVKKEETGSQINREVFEVKVSEYIAGFLPEMDMTEEECYVKPQFTEQSQEVIDACSAMNKYLTASITYTFGSSTEVVDKELISQWVKVDGNMAVTFDTNQVAEYIKGLASKYNTYGRQRTFTAGNGNTVNVEGGDYGWSIDRDAEYEALVASIQKGETVTKEPAYRTTAATHDGPDWGNTYVEVDLTNQYLYLFVNGAVVTQGPIVTGLPSRGDATPQGVYYIKYCQRNATLRGPKKPDGTYEWESPVSFWMPFNGGIGLHDAPWQAAFGGTRYLTHGSRGCVNLPYSVAETVFNNVSAGTPVVCHY